MGSRFSTIAILFLYTIYWFLFFTDTKIPSEINEAAKKNNPSVSLGLSEEEEKEEQKKRDASWKAMKYSFIAFGATFGIVGSYVMYELGNEIQTPMFS